MGKFRNLLRTSTARARSYGTEIQSKALANGAHECGTASRVYKLGRLAMEEIEIIKIDREMPTRLARADWKLRRRRKKKEEDAENLLKLLTGFFAGDLNISPLRANWTKLEKSPTVSPHLRRPF